MDFRAPPRRPRSAFEVHGFEEPAPKAAEPAIPLELAFLETYGVPRENLRRAASIAERLNAPPEAVLINEGFLSEERYYRCLANWVGAAYESDPPPLDGSVAPETAIATGLAALAPNRRGLRALVTPTGAPLRYLIGCREQGRSVNDLALTTPRRFRTFVRAFAGERIARSAAFALERVDPTLSARGGLSRRQCLALALAVAAACAAFGSAADAARPVARLLLLAFFAGAIWLRTLAFAAGERQAPPPPLDPIDLPVYTIVVALHREGAVAAKLLRALEALDYPRAKLEIKIVVESHDAETLEALAALRPGAPLELVVAPPGRPLTKPRALNVALAEARGTLLVVFDAEDEPAPGQLRLAAARFAAEPGVDCLQARLVVGNGGASWLSACFALEYRALFDFLNPGLAALDLPIALGGTSNHFRRRTLVRIGGWDAWNVTEDADLGLRLARFGARVATLDSETREEAPVTLYNWFRQRSRWQKGWMQTLIVHSRSPLRLTRELGAARALSAFLLVGGAVASGLLGLPLLLVTFARSLGAEPSRGFGAEGADVVTYMMVLWGAQVVLLPAALALRRGDIRRVALAVALTPAYYTLIFFASWAGLLDLVWRPFHWGKTDHGGG